MKRYNRSYASLPLGRSLLPLVVLSLVSLPAVRAQSGSANAQAASSTASSAVPSTAPHYMLPMYRSMIRVALEGGLVPVKPPSSIPGNGVELDTTGLLQTYLPGGSVRPSNNAFFQQLGTNGRTCATCHETSSGMSVSASSVQQRWLKTLGTDPIFAPVDGANCPSQAGSALLHPNNYSLLLNRALFRIALPVPQSAEFTVKVVSDPYRCNTDPLYSTSTDASGNVTQLVSIYRRSIMASNLKFKTFSQTDTQGAPLVDLVTGEPLVYDPDGLHYANGNIMSDGREPTLESQALDATLGHAQATKAPTPDQIAQIVAFETGVYSAQSYDAQGGSLTSNGATAGAITLAKAIPGVPALPGQEVINNFDAWDPSAVSESKKRASIYRGQQIFNNVTFFVSNDAGINNITGVPNGIPLSCSGCHSQVNGTTETFAHGQHSLGVGGLTQSIGGPAASTLLPIFEITCKKGLSTPFFGSTVRVNDPGKALISGKCADIGRFTTPQLHALSARAPYFHDGSAASLTDVVNFYNQRFKIGFTAQNTADLVAFLETL